MRNLSLVDHTCNVVGDCDDGSKLCIDSVTGSVYHVSTRGVAHLEFASNSGAYFPEVSWPEHEISTESIVSSDFLTALSVICVVTKEGDVITVNTDTYEVETVGSVSDGIDAASWSPDEELLVLVTGCSNVIVMTSEFDIVTELSLNQNQFGTQAFINVGWGKKETQFHGSIGKEAAKVKSNSIQPINKWDDEKSRITWKGDGQMFAVTYVSNEDIQCRRIRVLNREGEIQYTSEAVNGLEQALAWKPSGSLIASSQLLPTKHQIVFFEKNGLRHGEFVLPCKPDEMLVKELFWSLDSSVLLIWLIDKVDEKHLVQLWTSSNYFWFLKQQLSLQESIVSLKWDPQVPLKLHVLTKSNLNQYDLIYKTDISRGMTTNDLAQVAVVNGNKVNLTPFRQAIVPPPMCAYEVSLPYVVNAVIYAPSLVPDSEKCDLPEDSGFLESVEPPGKNSNNICIFCGSDTFVFLTLAYPGENLSDFDCTVKINELGGKGFNVQSQIHRVAGLHMLNWNRLNKKGKPNSFKQLTNWVWILKDTILATYRVEDDSVVAVISLENIGTDNGDVFVRSLIPIDGRIVNFSSSSDGSLIIAQFMSGELKEIDLATNQIVTWKNKIEETVTLGKVCKQVALSPLVGSEDLHPIGLTSRNHLYWQQKQLASNCTSFHLYSDYLLYTTSSHQLEVVPLSVDVFNLLASNSPEIKSKVGYRKIERGARLVTAIPGTSSVILQMPRGNVEHITPRALLVHSLKQLLDQHKYKEATEFMRKHRIDMNLLCDHNMDDFLENVETFVQSIDNPQYLDLFIANLNENNVTNTMYLVNYCEKNIKSISNDSKVDRVCIAIRNAMKKAGELKFLLPVLTTHVKMSTSEMHIAIKIIQELKSNNDNYIKTKAEEGLRHLLYIADANKLFDVALGTYDFELVMMVFEKSQKDPKEYLPFLNNLKKLEENYKKFKIDVHLRMFKQALFNIKSCCDDHFDECINLIRKEKLFKDALYTFPSDSKIYKTVAVDYAEDLSNTNRYNEAAIMYIRADKKEEALKAYKQSGDWKNVLIMASQLDYDKHEITKLCYSLIEDLKSEGIFGDAAVIYEQYLSSEEDSVENYVFAGEWENAFRVAWKYNRQDLIETNIKPGIKNQASSYDVEITDKITLFTQHCDRLHIVRSNLEKSHLDFLEGKDDNLDSDLYSDTSTVTGFAHSRATRSLTGSQKSSKSRMSSKSKRKLERKKHSTKEGSSYEDLGLVTSLHELMVSSGKLIKPISSILLALVSIEMDSTAKSLQNSFSSLLTLMQKRQNDIWLIDYSNVETVQENLRAEMTTEKVIELHQNNSSMSHQSIIVLRMRELEPHLRYPPSIFKDHSWKLSILSD